MYIDIVNDLLGWHIWSVFTAHNVKNMQCNNYSSVFRVASMVDLIVNVILMVATLEDSTRNGVVSIIVTAGVAVVVVVMIRDFVDKVTKWVVVQVGL